MASCTFTVPDKITSGDNFYGAVARAYTEPSWTTSCMPVVPASAFPWTARSPSH